MHSTKLTDRIKKEVSQTSLDVCDWIDNKLSEQGPWHSKTTEKETLNCLMRYHLSHHQDTSEVCQYLNNDDDDEAWVSSIATHVAPVVMKLCR